MLWNCFWTSPAGASIKPRPRHYSHHHWTHHHTHTKALVLVASTLTCVAVGGLIASGYNAWNSHNLSNPTVTGLYSGPALGATNTDSTPTDLPEPNTLWVMALAVLYTIRKAPRS